MAESRGGKRNSSTDAMSEATSASTTGTPNSSASNAQTIRNSPPAHNTESAKENSSLSAALGSGAGEISFRGCFEHAVDDKGRVSIPSAFRQLLLDRRISSLVLTNYICDGARCIEVYTEPDWHELEKRLERRSRFDPQVKRLENYYLARAAVCPIDGSGRINVPPHLRTYAGVEREVVFAATVRGFRIWDRRVWELIFQEAETALIEDPSIFENVDRD